jgi:hypothetical protein
MSAYEPQPKGVATAAAEPTHTGGLSRIAAPAAGAALVLAGLLICEVRAGELLSFTGFQLAFTLLPGLLLYLLLADRPRPALDALGLVVALGMAIQIACYLLAAAIGERWLFEVFPAILLAVSAPWLYGRRRSLAALWSRPCPPTRRSVLAALSLLAGGVAVMWLGLFAASPLPRSAASVSYYPDLVFNISLAAEILHHWPLMNPSVSGVGLHYHVFVDVQAAAAAQVTHVALANILLRLQPALLVSAIGLQLFSLGRRLGAGASAGFLAAAIGLFAGELNFSRGDLAGGGLSVFGFLMSPSYQLGAVFFLALVALLLDGLDASSRRSPTGRSRARHALMLALLSFGAVGAKSSVVPVLLGGLLLFALGGLAARRASDATGSRQGLRLGGPTSLAIAVLLGAGAGGYALLYRGGGEAVRVKPLDFLSYSHFASVYHRAGDSLLYALPAAIAAVLVLALLLAPLLGVLFLRERWLPRAAAGTPERLLLCLLLASLAPFVLLAVPGDSQVYFLVYGFLAAAPVSAAGLTKAARSLSRRAPQVAGWRRPALASALALVCLALASGLYEPSAQTLQRLLHTQPSFQVSGADSHRGITRELLRGLIWVRDHTPQSAVLVVNNHGLGGDGGSRYVYYSAFAERRVLLESWQYTPQGAEYQAEGRSASPFPKLLALSEAAVDGSPVAIARLHRRYGVDYLLIDRAHGPSSPKLASVARVAYANPAVAVFEVGRANGLTGPSSS